MKNAFANPRGADALHRCDIRGNRRMENGGDCERVCGAHRDGDGGRELNRVHMSPKRACHRVEKRRYIWRASICRSPLIWQHLHTAYSLWAIYSLANSPLLAFGHQCVWLTLLVAPLTPDYISICIHSRTSLKPNRSSALARTHYPSLVPPVFRRFSSRSCADDWPTIFALASSLSRGYTRVIFFHAGMCAGCRCDVDRRRRFDRGCDFARWWCNLLCVFRDCYLGIHRGFCDRWIWTNSFLHDVSIYIFRTLNYLRLIYSVQNLHIWEKVFPTLIFNT